MWGLPACSFVYVGGPLMHLMHYLICCEVCEVRRPVPGRCRWVCHTSYCFVVMCVRSTDLLLGCVRVGGPLMHHLLCYVIVYVRSADLLLGCVGETLSLIISFCCGVCGVCRSAHGRCRLISHASSHLIHCF